MLKGRFAVKLNRKTATFLAVPCLLGMVLFYSLGGGAGYGASTSADAPVTAASPVASAQDVPANPFDASAAQSEPGAASGFDMAMDVIVKLVIVVALIFALTKVLQYVNGRSRSRTGGRNAITVVESLNLAQNQVLYLIEVGEKALLVGATGAQLATLTEITDPAAIASLHEKMEARPAPRDSFARYLQRVSGGLQAQSQTIPATAVTRSKLREATALIRTITAQSRQSTSFATTEDSGAAVR